MVSMEVLESQDQLENKENVVHLASEECQGNLESEDTRE
jgi:hypothetical protein